MSRNIKNLLFLLLVLTGSINNKIEAQCSGSPCTITYSGTGPTIYTLNAGQTLCIPVGLVFTGTINLNGGVVNNNGVMQHPLTINFNTINGGTITNCGSISKKGD